MLFSDMVIKNKLEAHNDVLRRGMLEVVSENGDEPLRIRGYSETIDQLSSALERHGIGLTARSYVPGRGNTAATLELRREDLKENFPSVLQAVLKEIGGAEKSKGR